MIRRKLPATNSTNSVGGPITAVASNHDGISWLDRISMLLVAGLNRKQGLTVLIVVVAVIVLGSITQLQQQQQQHQETPRSETGHPSEFHSHSCVQTLLQNKQAILANATLSKKSISFSILLHPEGKDKYITWKIKQKGTYEPEMEEFIARALPLKAKAKALRTQNSTVWAVDIGANIGFHTLHMARRGAHVIAFEPAPDTAALIQCTASELFGDAEGAITVIEAGASDTESAGKMSRHPASPGMTTFGDINQSFPLEELKNSAGKGTTAVGLIRLLRAEHVLAEHGVPEGRSDALRLLKVDAEGFELRALRGINLTRFPFQLLTFEFFPEMLRASGDAPVDLLMFVREAGYDCDYERKLPATSSATRDELDAWVSGIKSHVNIFCELKAYSKTE